MEVLSDLIDMTTRPPLPGMPAQFSVNQSANSPVVRAFEDADLLKRLFEYVIASEKRVIFTSGLKIFTELIRKHSATKHDPNAELAATSTAISLVCSSYLAKIEALLETPCEMVDISTSYGVLHAPFGYCRVAVVELVEALVATGYCCVLDEIAKTRIFKIVFKMFFEYEWNNFLHQSVNKIFSVVMASSVDDVKKHILVDCEFLANAAKAEEENAKLFEEHHMSRGYIAHLTVMARLLMAFDEGVVSTIRDGLYPQAHTPVPLSPQLTETKALQDQGGSDRPAFCFILNWEYYLIKSCLEHVVDFFLFCVHRECPVEGDVRGVCERPYRAGEQEAWPAVSGHGPELLCGQHDLLWQPDE